MGTDIDSSNDLSLFEWKFWVLESEWIKQRKGLFGNRRRNNFDSLSKLRLKCKIILHLQNSDEQPNLPKQAFSLAQTASEMILSPLEPTKSAPFQMGNSWNCYKNLKGRVFLMILYKNIHFIAVYFACNVIHNFIIIPNYLSRESLITLLPR